MQKTKNIVSWKQDFEYNSKKISAPLCNGFATFMCILAYLESLVSRWWESERFYSPVDNKVELVMEAF